MLSSTSPNGEDSLRNMTIRQVLTAFLDAQKSRLSAKTFNLYRNSIQLLMLSIDSYGSNGLDQADIELFEEHCGKVPADQQNFCDFFGPQRIVSNVSEFLNYFMVRKVVAGRDQMRAAGTVTKKLLKWLSTQGCVVTEETEGAVERAGAAARDLPLAQELGDLLRMHAENQAYDVGDGDVEDHFEFVRVEPGKLWLEGSLELGPFGPIRLPAYLTERIELTWRVSGVIGRRRGRWHLLDVWNVYPR